jgi:Domain of unknown function (DUF5664)
MSEGKKSDTGKPRVDLIPVEFTIGVAKALTFGANKYGQHNFRNGISYSRLLAATIRHLQLELAGIDNDRDTKEPHWQNAGAGIAMYAFMKTHRPDQDDRFQYTDEQKKLIEQLMYGEE